MILDENHKKELLKQLFKNVKEKHNISIQEVIEKFKLVFLKLSKNLISDEDKFALSQSILREFLSKNINAYDYVLVENKIEIKNIKGKESKFFNAIFPLFNDYFQYLCKLHNLKGIECSVEFGVISGNISGYVNLTDAMRGQYKIILSKNHTVDTMFKKFAYEFTHIKQVIKGTLRIDSENIYWNTGSEIQKISITTYKKILEKKRKNIHVKNEYKFPWSIECESNQKQALMYFASKQHKNFMAQFLVESSKENYMIVKNVISSF